MCICSVEKHPIWIFIILGSPTTLIVGSNWAKLPAEKKAPFEEKYIAAKGKYEADMKVPCCTFSASDTVPALPDGS
jgi:hypothetical protein